MSNDQILFCNYEASPNRHLQSAFVAKVVAPLVAKRAENYPVCRTIAVQILFGRANLIDNLLRLCSRINFLTRQIRFTCVQGGVCREGQGTCPGH